MFGKKAGAIPGPNGTKIGMGIGRLPKLISETSQGIRRRVVATSSRFIVLFTKTSLNTGPSPERNRSD
jgi:hypothetical protein